jgi:murein DD-endopeptidase MepM/ murein hydrolase activator NlpD
MKRVILQILNVIVVAATLTSAPASAISDADNYIINTRSQWYNQNACNTGSTSNGGGTNSTGVSVLHGNGTPEKIYNFFIDQGFTDMQVAAVMGNFQQESTFNPRAVQGGGGAGRGLAQWGIGGRFDTDPVNLTKFARGEIVATEKGDVWDLAIQLDFVMYELKNVSEFQKAFQHFQAVPSIQKGTTDYTNLLKASSIFGKEYEGYGTNGRRDQDAIDWFKGGLNTGSGGTGGGGGDNNSPTCAGGTNGGTGVSGNFTFPQITTQATIINQKPLRWCYTNQTSCHHNYKAADIMANEGTINLVAVSGTVMRAIDMNSCPGSTKYDVPRVQIKGDDGNYYYYTHMKPGSIKVHDNQKVSAGDPLGQVGPTQCAENTQPHLHFQISSVPVTNTNDPAEQAKYIDPQPSLIAAFKNLPEK